MEMIKVKVVYGINGAQDISWVDCHELSIDKNNNLLFYINGQLIEGFVSGYWHHIRVITKKDKE